MKLIKKAISLKYFSEILKFPPDLSQALYSFISEQTEPNSVKQKFYLSKIRSQNPKTKNFIVLENKNEIVENPLFLKQLFPFKEEEKEEEHHYEKEIKIMTSNNEAYTQWVKKLIDSGKIKEEDFAKIKQFLDDFSSLVNRKVLIGKDANINNYVDDSQLFNQIQKYKKDEKRLQFNELLNNEHVQSGSDILVKNGNVVLFVVKSFGAIKLLGASTAWCVANAETDFKSYGPPFYLFYIDEEPEILVHFGSHQIKAKDDSTAFNPYYVYLIDDILKSIEPENFEYSGDFEDYKKIIDKYKEYITKNPEEIKSEIETNPTNMIYVTPENYGMYIKSFVKNIILLNKDFIYTFSKNFLQYLGNYLKITNQQTKFDFLENLIIDYLNSGYSHTDYFKRIPKAFHTKKVYEKGYIGSLKNELASSLPPYSYLILNSLNPSEKERKDVQDAWLNSFKSNLDDRFYLPEIFKMISVLIFNKEETFQTYTDTGEEKVSGKDLFMGKENEIFPLLFISIKNILSKNPEAYEEIPPEIKELKEMFEATKAMIENKPENHILVPESMKYSVRFAIFNGYIDLAKKIVKGEESYSRLQNAPLFVTKNPKYQKILEQFKKNENKELEYQLKGLKDAEDFLEPEGVNKRYYDFTKKTLINLLEKIDKNVLKDKKNFLLILNFIGSHGFQYRFLPIELKENKQIIEMASRSILEQIETKSNLISHVPKELMKTQIFNRIKQEFAEDKKIIKDLEYKGKNQDISDEYSLQLLKTFENGLLSALNGKKLNVFISAISKDKTIDDLKDDKEFLNQIFPMVVELIPNYLKEISSSFSRQVRNLGNLNNLFDGKIIELEIFKNIIINEAIKNFKENQFIIEEIESNFPNLLKNSDKFINSTYSIARDKVIENLEYPRYVEELNTLFKNYLLEDFEILKLIKQKAIEALENKDLSKFVIFDNYTRGKLKKDPEIVSKFGYLKDLYSSNWYSKIKI